MEGYKDIPVWEKYTLSVKEAASYFNIGENRIRTMANENKNADWVLWNCSKLLIKRKLFEKYVDTINYIK